jgi:capsular exopolysaccharide synthesis family protein
VGKVRLSEAVQTTLKETHLAFLSSGSHAPSPGDLLTDRTVRGLLEGLRKFYDWVVIDTPPVGAVSEPLTLAPMTDGVILVVGAEMVPRKAVLHTLERVHETGARILGVVLNRAQVDKHSYYYSHYYGHYYGREYGTRDGTTSGGHHAPAARSMPGDGRAARDGKVTSIGATRARAGGQ